MDNFIVSEGELSPSHSWSQPNAIVQKWKDASLTSLPTISHKKSGSTVILLCVCGAHLDSKKGQSLLYSWYKVMKQPKEYYSIASERGERMGGIFGSEESLSTLMSTLEGEVVLAAPRK